jgi:hypothetical protein
MAHKGESAYDPTLHDCIAQRGEDAVTLGLSLSQFTTLHVAISLVAIAAGFVVLYGMLTGQRPGGWTLLFLAATVLTSVTGFMFPIGGLTPGLVIGAISLVLLAIALLALYAFRLAGPWRWLYVATALAALYLNVFVGVVQAFQKLPFLQPLAPTQSEPPFAVAQLAVLAVFLVLGFAALRRFQPMAAAAA